MTSIKGPDREFQVFVKPVGPGCNLACSYCYYGGSADGITGTAGKLMDRSLLEIYIRQHIDATTGSEIFFSWHGGEPLLAGIDFYREALAIQKRHQPPGKTILNGIQTNATLLDGDWCRFLAEGSFIVGLSIDGPREMHDLNRKEANGNGTHERVLRGLRLLQQSGIDFEILCVVNSVNAMDPLGTYRYFRDLGARFITFLPLVERREEGVSEMSVPPGEFGDFLISIFEEWKANDIGKVKVQLFEEALRTAFHQEHTLCIFRKVCGGVPVIESNGNMYSCDHYVNPEHLLGNIREASLATLLDSKKQADFGRNKSDSLPLYCRQCEVLEMCNGECPRNRFITAPGGEPGLNYLCEGYRKFFNHSLPFTKAVSHLWRRQNLGGSA